MKRKKLLVVHHGFPPEHEAGSEVYTYNLVRSMSRLFDIKIFYRTLKNNTENGYFIKKIDGITHYIIKEPDEYDFEYLHEFPKVDKIFGKIIDEFKPHYVYFGHLNHLSLGLVEIAYNSGAKIIFTLHDYWLLCPRGQFIGRDLKICEPYDETRCIKCILQKYGKSAVINGEEDAAVILKRRRSVINKIFEMVHYFIAPSRFLRNKFIEFGAPAEKIIYRDYGFNTELFKDYSSENRKERIDKRQIIIGYCGTAIPSKGLEVLIKAFNIICQKYNNRFPNGSDPFLHIHASPHARLKDYYRKIKEMVSYNPRIKLFGKYSNSSVAKVLEGIDIMVVPSIWYENSPLVIHEAYQAGIPVITSDKGGMAELVKDGVNGLLFKQGDAYDLAEKLIYFLENPNEIFRYGSNHPGVHTIESDALFIAKLFNYLDGSIPRGPWRITFDTNPDDCNLSCIMCEGFSPYNKKSHRILYGGKPRRMPFEIIEKVVWNALPFGLKEIIPSTMGEPLLFGDFDRIIGLCKEAGIKLNLTTNGTFPGKSIEEWAELLIPVCSDIKISWNGSYKELQENIMRGSNFERRLKNLGILIKYRDEYYRKTGEYCSITLQMTFMKRNIDNITGLIEMAYKYGVDRIKGHHVWVLYPEIEKESLLHDPESIKLWNEMVEKAVYYNKKLARKYGYTMILDNFVKKIDNRSSVNDDLVCPFLRREAWIAWDGTFNICCAPDELRKRLGQWGNVKDSDFIFLWYNPELEYFAEHYSEYDICKKCVLRRPKHDCKIPYSLRIKPPKGGGYR